MTWREAVARFGGTSHWVDLDGPLHYVEFGPGHATNDAGPPVVLVHGLGGSFVDWLALAPLLARDHRVLALDLPGHGLTPAAGRRLKLLDLQGLLNRFLLTAGATHPLVVGNSLGGAVVALHAAAWPRVPSGVVLVDPVLPLSPRVRPHPLVLAGFGAYATPGLGRHVLDRRRSLLSPEVLVAEALNLVCAQGDRVPTEVVETAVLLAEHRKRYPPDDATFLTAARDVVRQALRPATYRLGLAAVQAPVLLIHGEHDRFVPVEAALRALRAYPAWERALLPTAGHLPQLEAAPEVAELISAFAARLATQAG